MVETKVVSLATVRLSPAPKIIKNKFKDDVSVVLKGGEQVMEVEKQENGFVHCVWQDGQGITQRDIFRAGNLRKLTANETVKYK